jgi:hypothetical protein
MFFWSWFGIRSCHLYGVCLVQLGVRLVYVETFDTCEVSALTSR